MANADFYRLMEQAEGLSVDERLLLVKLLVDRVTGELLAAGTEGPEPDRRLLNVRGEAEDAQRWVNRIRQEAAVQRSAA